MATTVNLRKILDRKQWEMCTPLPVTPLTQQAMAVSALQIQTVFVKASTVTTGAYLYRPDEDSFLAMPDSGTTMAVGGCACATVNGPTGTASAGSATTITTTTTVAINLAGYAIRITAGTGAGQEKIILSNTIGANAVITTGTWGTNPDNTSVYLLLTGRFYVYHGGAAVMRSYDIATNVWSAGTAQPTSVSSEGQLVSTPGYMGQTGLGTGFATGTATSGSATTVVNSGKAWAVNQWAQYQVRITGGTGAGKVATITSNTSTTLTFPTVTTVLDNTSVYIIEGNDDFLYLMGGAAVTLQRYSISLNTWTTLVPSPVRTTGTAATGCCAVWANAATDTLWATENANINGRRIYSVSSLAANPIDYYDIPSNAWTSAVAIGRLGAAEGVTTLVDMCGTMVGDNLYLALGGGSVSPLSSGRVLRINLPRQTMDPWATLVYPASAFALIPGVRIFPATYTDGGTVITWIYMFAASLPSLFRCMII